MLAFASSYRDPWTKEPTFCWHIEIDMLIATMKECPSWDWNKDEYLGIYLVCPD